MSLPFNLVLQITVEKAKGVEVEDVVEEVAKDAEDDDDEEDEQTRIVGEGECELCEREMPLTKHHLIPREVWFRSDLP